MDPIRQIIENSTNPLTIHIAQEYENKKIEVIILPFEEKPAGDTTKYNFSI